MADMAQIEQRLSMLEAGLSEVQRHLGLVPTDGNWIEQVSGSLADIPEEDYQRFLEQCRAVRGGASVSDAEGARP